MSENRPHRLYLVVAYFWDDQEKDKVFFSEAAADQRADFLNTCCYLNIQWRVEELEVGD